MARLISGRTHHRDAPISTAVGPITGTPRWDTWQGRVAPSITARLLSVVRPTTAPPTLFPSRAGKGLPEWWALRGSGRVSSWPEVRAYRRASLPLRFGEVRPKGSTFSLHPARRSVRSPRWSAIFQSSEALGLPRLIITLKPLLRSSFVFWCCVLSSQGSSQVSAKVFCGSSFVEVVLRRF